VASRTTHSALLLAACVLLGSVLPAVASGAQSARLQVALTPERLGRGTTIEFGLTIAAPAGVVPSPLTGIDLAYPRHFGIATSGLGVATCSLAVLEALGSRGCPANSQMGSGEAMLAVRDGPELVREAAAVSVFMAPVRDGRVALLFYADGTTPLFAQLVFPGLLLPAPAPFGGDVAIKVPIVPSLPEAPDVATLRMRATIGPRGLTYYERVDGRLVGYRPRGIALPRRCPRGGFPFAATLSFADSTSVVSRDVVRCPGHLPKGPSPERVKLARAPWPGADHGAPLWTPVEAEEARLGPS
jgi:hypothetical protein